MQTQQSVLYDIIIYKNCVTLKMSRGLLQERPFKFIQSQPGLSNKDIGRLLSK